MFTMILIPFYIASPFLSLSLTDVFYTRILHQNGGDLMTLEQARAAIEEEYPGQDIGLGFKFGGYWYFRVGIGIDGGFHAVDPKTGVVTGCLPTMSLLLDKKFATAAEKAGKEEAKRKGEEDPLWWML